jgi:hypothetical protein
LNVPPSVVRRTRAIISRYTFSTSSSTTKQSSYTCNIVRLYSTNSSLMHFYHSPHQSLYNPIPSGSRTAHNWWCSICRSALITRYFQCHIQYRWLEQ